MLLLVQSNVEDTYCAVHKCIRHVNGCKNRIYCRLEPFTRDIANYCVLMLNLPCANLLNMNQVKQARHGLIQNSDADTKAERSSRMVDIAPLSMSSAQGLQKDL